LYFCGRPHGSQHDFDKFVKKDNANKAFPIIVRSRFCSMKPPPCNDETRILRSPNYEEHKSVRINTKPSDGSAKPLDGGTLTKQVNWLPMNFAVVLRMIEWDIREKLRMTVGV
jgi:hypothetical protein